MSQVERRSPDWREWRRFRAAALHEEGWTGQEIAEALGVSEGAVSQWLKRLREGGQDALRANLSELPTAIEEALRFRSPVTRVECMATRDVSLRGQHIAHGEEVHLWLASANRDERVFPNPAEFVIDRHPNRHLAFATGIHFCLGAPLARLELQCALDIMLRRFSRFCVDADRPPAAYPTPVFSGVKNLYLLVERT